jgi:hypothetical protein
MTSRKGSAEPERNADEQDKQRVKRLRAALREHSAAIDRVRNAVDAQKLQGLLDRNDELSNDIDDVLAHGLLTEAYLKITLLERELVAKVKTGLSVLDTEAFLDRLSTNWSAQRNGTLQHNDDRVARQSSREANVEEPPTDTDVRNDDNEASNPPVSTNAQRILDLDALGKRFYRYFRTAPAPEFMLGPLDFDIDASPTSCRDAQTPAESRSRSGRERNQNADLEHAEQVSLGDIHEQVRTDVEVKRMFDFMRERGPVELYELVLDPNSFGRTIENIFHLSFLIRDGRVHLWREADRLMLRPLQRHEQTQSRPGIANAGVPNDADLFGGDQTVLRFNWQDWKALCRQHGKTAPLLQRCHGSSPGDRVAET